MQQIFNQLTGQYWKPIADPDSIAQADLSAWHDLPPPPTAIGAASNYTSNVISADGFKAIVAAITSTQAGAILIQRYNDGAGKFAQGAAISTTLVAATPAVVKANDGLPFRSFTIKITNSSIDSIASLSGFTLLLNAVG